MIPEPTTDLWLWARRLRDTIFIWPVVDEDAAERMGDAWDQLGLALQTGVSEANRGVRALPTVWRDGAGTIYHVNADSMVNGSGGSGGYSDVVQMMAELAKLCHDFALNVQHAKRQIYAELAANAGLFALTFLLPPGIGDLFRFKFAAQMVEKFSAIIRTAAGLVEHAAPATFPRALGRLAGEIVAEGIEEAGIEVAAQASELISGYRENWDLKQILVNAGAGGLGAPMAKIISPVGRIGTAPASRIADRLGIEGAGRKILVNSSGAFYVNGLTSPISGTVAQGIADGNLGDYGLGDYLGAIRDGGLVAGGLASGRIASVHAGDALGRHVFPARVPAVETITPDKIIGTDAIDPNGPTPPPQVADPGRTASAVQAQPGTMTQAGVATQDVGQSVAITEHASGIGQAQHDLSADQRIIGDSSDHLTGDGPNDSVTGPGRALAAVGAHLDAAPTPVATAASAPINAAPQVNATPQVNAAPQVNTAPQVNAAAQINAAPQVNAASQTPMANAAQAPAVPGQPAAAQTQGSAPAQATTSQSAPGQGSASAQPQGAAAANGQPAAQAQSGSGHGASSATAQGPAAAQTLSGSPAAKPASEPGKADAEAGKADSDGSRDRESVLPDGMTTGPSGPGTPVARRVVEVEPGPPFKQAAYDAFVAELNERDAFGELTPAAQELRRYYYRKPDVSKETGKRTTVVQRFRRGKPVDEMTFPAAVPGGPVHDVPVPVLRYLPTDDFAPLVVRPGRPIGRTDVSFDDPDLRLTVDERIDLQRAVDRWMKSLGKLRRIVRRPTAAERAAREELTNEEFRKLLDEYVEVDGLRPQQTGEALGEAFAHVMLRWLENQYPGEVILRVPVKTMGGSGRFDQIYVRMGDTGRILGLAVVEAKGVNGALGSRRGPDGTSYQQGHREYVRSILAAMARRAGPLNEKGIAAAIEAALEGGNVQYFVAKAWVERLPNRARAKGIAVTEYDLRPDPQTDDHDGRSAIARALNPAPPSVAAAEPEVFFEAPLERFIPFQ